MMPHGDSLTTAKDKDHISSKSTFKVRQIDGTVARHNKQKYDRSYVVLYGISSRMWQIH
jgi:hypothetical protein